MKKPLRDRTLIAALFLIAVIATFGLIQFYNIVIVPALAAPPTLDQLYISAIEDAMIAKPK